MVDRGPSRRSKQEVEKAKQEKEAAKLEAARQKTANIQKVAEIERASTQKAREMERQANNPTDKLSQPRVKRTRNQPEMGNQGTTYIHDRRLTDDVLTWTLAQKTKNVKRTLTL
jgi:methylthioribose-1-phosphate isomerase